MKQRYKLFIEYKGMRYSGWQKQPNAKTVEEEVEKAFSQILRQAIDIIGQGRTDSGVHAEKQIAHVDIEPRNDVPDLLYALRGVLPTDICVWKMEKVSSDFHARFDAKSRQYRYQILTRSSPLLRDVAVFEANPLDVEMMQRCAEMVKGTHDFKNFSRANRDQKNTICTVHTSSICRSGILPDHVESGTFLTGKVPVLQKKDFLITYRIKANRFVHNMVRRLVGTMLEVGKGKLSIGQFEELLNNPETELKSTGITGKGLILEDVSY